MLEEYIKVSLIESALELHKKDVEKVMLAACSEEKEFISLINAIISTVLGTLTDFGTVIKHLPKCKICNNTGYKDYAGFQMDPCFH